MSRLPEQEAALAWARRRGTNATLESIRSRVAATYAEFEALVADISEPVARAHHSTSAWSIQEVLDHLIVSEAPAVGQLRRLVAGESVTDPLPASLQSPQPLDAGWDDVRARFRAVHQEILDVLAHASDVVPLTATAAVTMVVKCAGSDGQLKAVQWIEHFDWKAYAILLHAHNREHIAQVQRILGAVGAGGIIRSPRLELRPVSSADVSDLHALWTSAGVRRYLWDDQVIPLEQTRDMVRLSGELFASHRFGLFGVRLAGGDALVGFAGFWHFRSPPELELLFGVHQDYWKQGIATEAARRVVDYGFEELGFREIRASTDVANAASSRVLEKLGMTLVRREVVDGLDTLFYSMASGGAAVAY